MKKPLLTLLFVILSGQSLAEQNNQSIMFQGSHNQPNTLTSIPAKNLGDHCEQLAKEIAAMKGKPQRRYALSERYKNECELNR